jgi:ATP-dependent RNA helicase DeaD
MNETPQAPDEAGATDPADYVSDVSFDDLPLADELRRAVRERGWAQPTPVQAKAFLPAVAGKDLIVRSKTGTGKTGAFGLPLLQQLQPGERAVKAIVLCPTRELALQVAGELKELAKHRDIQVAAIYGGASMRDQEDALEDGAAIVVGTPGRVIDHVRRGNLKLQSCAHAVLDEADEMLDQGFYEDVTRILDFLPKDRQVLLFSATVPEDIQRLIARYTTNAETILMSGDVYTVDHIHHVRYEISDAYPKPRNLIYVLEMEEPDNAIIFCNTRTDTSLVTAVLNRNGFDAELLNGELPQKERERVMAKIKRGEVAFMVATDLAARGIDISDLGYVINYSLPEDPATYLHRVGRTGRIGKKGVAINLTSGRELATLTALEKKYGINFERRQMPQPEEAEKMWTDRHVKEIKAASGSAVYEGFFGLAAQLKQRPDSEDLIAFLIKYFFTHHRMEKAQARDQADDSLREELDKPRRERAERLERERPPREARPARDRADRPRERERSRGRDTEERPRSKSRSAIEPAPGQAKLWIGLGKAEGLDEGDLRDALTGLGAPGDKVIALDLRPGFTYAIVAEADVAAFEAASGRQHNGRAVRMERARPPGERSTRERPARRDEPMEAEGEIRVWTSLGSDAGLDEAGVKAALSAAGAPVDKVLRVLMRPQYSYVVVRDEDVAAFEAVSGQPFGDKTLKIERARPRR